MKRRRLLSPFHTVFLLLFALLYGSWSLTVFALFRNVGLEGQADTEIRDGAHRFLILGLGIFGALRFAVFHPVFNAKYTNWLRASPWTYRQPLPLGPIHLAWQDLLILIPAGLLARYHLHHTGAGPIIAALGGYAIAAALTQLVTARNISILLIAFGLPLIVPLYNWPWIVLAVYVAIYIGAVLGIRGTLRHFPWKGAEPRLPADAAGWLFTRLGPVDPQLGCPLHVALITSLLAGWWILCMTSIFPFPSPPECYATLWGAFVFPGIILALVRLCVYCAYFWPPISIFGRIATGRLIVPGYDQALVSPLIVGIVSVAFPFGFYSGVAPSLIFASFTFVVLFCTLAIGPSRHRWVLTGQHRIINRKPAEAQTRGGQRSQPLSIRFS